MYKPDISLKSVIKLSNSKTPSKTNRFRSSMAEYGTVETNGLDHLPKTPSACSSNLIHLYFSLFTINSFNSVNFAYKYLAFSFQYKFWLFCEYSRTFNCTNNGGISLIENDSLCNIL